MNDLKITGTFWRQYEQEQICPVAMEKIKLVSIEKKVARTGLVVEFEESFCCESD
jgi:hypothetical protein